MGSSMSSQARAKRAEAKEAKARSDAIDRQLKKESRERRNERNVLLLGSAESGKSTIARQMKIIHQGGLTDDELMTYRPTIYRNTLDSAQAIVLAMHKIGLDYIDNNNRTNADCILDFRIDSSPNFVFSSEITEAIHQLWQDPIISELMDNHRSEFYLMDSAVYFFTHVRRIGTPAFQPTEEDVLRACLKSTAIAETRFTTPRLQIRVFEVGGPCPRAKKWFRCLDNVTSIIFCVALSEYDQVSLEEVNQNRLGESLRDFESIVNMQWSWRTSIILLFTKLDVFKTKFPRVPLERCFPEYPGGADINKALKYIIWRFVQTNHARRHLYLYPTHSVDSTVIRLVFAVVKDTILQNAVRGLEVL